MNMEYIDYVGIFRYIYMSGPMSNIYRYVHEAIEIVVPGHESTMRYTNEPRMIASILS